MSRKVRQSKKMQETQPANSFTDLFIKMQNEFNKIESEFIVPHQDFNFEKFSNENFEKLESALALNKTI